MSCLTTLLRLDLSPNLTGGVSGRLGLTRFPSLNLVDRTPPRSRFLHGWGMSFPATLGCSRRFRCRPQGAYRWHLSGHLAWDPSGVMSNHLSCATNGAVRRAIVYTDSQSVCRIVLESWRNSGTVFPQVCRLTTGIFGRSFFPWPGVLIWTLSELGGSRGMSIIVPPLVWIRFMPGSTTGWTLLLRRLWAVTSRRCSSTW